MPASAQKRPRTPAQQEAARRNGARSKGPRTAAGKARSAMNAVRHGMCAETLGLLAGEPEAEYRQLRADLWANLMPAGSAETETFERLARAHWGLRRADLQYAAVMDECLAAHGSMTEALLAAERPLELIRRYRAHLAAEVQRCQRVLEAARDRRRAEAARLRERREAAERRALAGRDDPSIWAPPPRPAVPARDGTLRDAVAKIRADPAFAAELRRAMRTADPATARNIALLLRAGGAHVEEDGTNPADDLGELRGAA